MYRHIRTYHIEQLVNLFRTTSDLRRATSERRFQLWHGQEGDDDNDATHDMCTYTYTYTYCMHTFTYTCRIHIYTYTYVMRVRIHTCISYRTNWLHTEQLLTSYRTTSWRQCQLWHGRGADYDNEAEQSSFSRKQRRTLRTQGFFRVAACCSVL